MKTNATAAQAASKADIKATSVKENKNRRVNGATKAKPEKKRGLRTLRALIALISAAMVIAAGGAIAIATLLIPKSSLSDAQMALAPGAVAASEGQLSLVCLGGAQRPIAQGVNATDTDEQISGSGSVLINPAASAPQQVPAGAQWRPYPADGASGAANALAANVISAGQAITTDLGASALAGEVVLERAGAAAMLLTGGNWHRANAGDLRGFAYSPCVWPSNSAWLVGGSSTVGSANRLIIANPGATSLDVRIKAFTSLGEVPLGSASVALLPAHSIRTVPLEGIIATDEKIALHLSADSGKFAAALQASQLSGFTAGGIDFVQLGRSGRELVIPGLWLPAGEVNLGGLAGSEQTSVSELVDPNVTASVRIVNPGEQPRTANVALVGSDGRVTPLPGGTGVEVTPGGVLDLSLEGVAPGDYAVQITADGEVAGGAMMRYAFEDSGSDVAWLAAVDAASTAAAAVAGGEAHLVVTPQFTDSVRAAEVTWKAYDSAGGEVASGTVAANGTIALDLPAQSAFVRIDANVPVYSAVVGSTELTGGKGIAWVGLNPAGAAAAATSMLFEN